MTGGAHRQPSRRTLAVRDPQTGWNYHLEYWVPAEPLSWMAYEAISSILAGETAEQWEARRGGEEQGHEPREA